MLVIIAMATCDSEPLGGATSLRCSWHWPKVHQPLPGLVGGLMYWTQCERYIVSSASPGIGGSYIWAVTELPKALDIELILFLILSSDKTSDSFALKFLGGSWLTTRLWCRVCLFHTESNSSYLWWCEKYADFLQWKKCGTTCPSVAVTLTQMAPPYLLWRKKSIGTATDNMFAQYSPLSMKQATEASKHGQTKLQTFSDFSSPSKAAPTSPRSASHEWHMIRTRIEQKEALHYISILYRLQCKIARWLAGKDISGSLIAHLSVNCILLSAGLHVPFNSL